MCLRSLGECLGSLGICLGNLGLCLGSMAECLGSLGECLGGLLGQCLAGRREHRRLVLPRLPSKRSSPPRRMLSSAASRNRLRYTAYPRLWMFCLWYISWAPSGQRLRAEQASQGLDYQGLGSAWRVDVNTAASCCPACRLGTLSYERGTPVHQRLPVALVTFGIWGFGVWVWGLRFRVWGWRFGVWGLGFGVWSLGFEIRGLRCRVPASRWPRASPHGIQGYLTHKKHIPPRTLH